MLYCTVYLYPNAGVNHFYGTFYWSYHAIAIFKLKNDFLQVVFALEWFGTSFQNFLLSLSGSERILSIFLREKGLYSIQITIMSVPSSIIGSPRPSPLQVCVPSSLGSWRDTLACGGGGGGSKFRRPARNSGTVWFFSPAEWLGRRNSDEMNQNFRLFRVPRKQFFSENGNPTSSCLAWSPK